MEKTHPVLMTLIKDVPILSSISFVLLCKIDVENYMAESVSTTSRMLLQVLLCDPYMGICVTWKSAVQKHVVCVCVCVRVRERERDLSRRGKFLCLKQDIFAASAPAVFSAPQSPVHQMSFTQLYKSNINIQETTFSFHSSNQFNK